MVQALVVAALVVGLAAPAAYSAQTAATAHTGALPTAGPGGHGPGGQGGRGIMALLDGVNPQPALTELPRSTANGHTWVAASIGSEVATSYQLAAGAPVMAVGGYNGTDPSPTLANFQALVRAGAIH